MSYDVHNSVCFSAEKAGSTNLKEHGIDNVETWIGQSTPEQYSGDLSLFVLDAGIRLIEEARADFLYLTLSDFVQHKYAPGSKEANDFMKKLDERIGKIYGLGAIIAITGDHGM